MNPLGRPGLDPISDLVYASVAVIYPEVVKLYRYSTELRVRICQRMFAGEKLATLASELRLSPETLHPWNNDALIDNDPSLVQFLLLELRFLYVGPN